MLSSPALAAAASTPVPPPQAEGFPPPPRTPPPSVGAALFPPPTTGGGREARDRGELLADIHRGIALKRVERRPAPVSCGRRALLDQIRMGKKLRKIEEIEPEVVCNIGVSDANSKDRGDTSNLPSHGGLAAVKEYANSTSGNVNPPSPSGGGDPPLPLPLSVGAAPPPLPIGDGGGGARGREELLDDIRKGVVPDNSGPIALEDQINGDRKTLNQVPASMSTSTS